jgi:two-component system response regulator YcbB
MDSVETSFYIIDDDKVIQRILRRIITQKNLGNIIGMSDNGRTAIEEMKILKPDIVLVDLLMPEIDGIEVILTLKRMGCESAFIMISQVDSKEMISRAYSEGVEFYINKPINVIEVVSVIKSVQEKYKMAKAIYTFESVMKSMNISRQSGPVKKVEEYDERTKLKKVLAQLGVLGEAGCQDIIEIVLWLNKKGLPQDDNQTSYKLFQAFNYLKEKYETEQHIQINTGAIEQRIRRAIKGALKNLASIGIEDYYDDIFVSYSAALFDFSEVRKEMDFERGKSSYGGTINVKKFIEGIIVLLMDKG